MLLSEILNLLYIYSNSIISNSDLTHLTPLQKMESEHIFKKLESMVLTCNFKKRISKEPNAVLNDEEEKWFVNLLESRWLRIQSTNSSYTQHTGIPANKICIALAKGLANTLNQPYFDILMPTLKGISNPVVIQQYTNNSNLCEFVMTDDNTMLIHIDSAFVQFKHTGTMTNSDNIALSETEMAAVINHTKATLKYYDLLVEVNEITAKTDTLGYELHQLILSLEQGSESLADIIVKFSKVMSRRSESQLEILFGSLFYDDNQHPVSFKILWNLVSDNSNQEISAQDLASQLKKILENNFILYLTPSKPGKINALSIQAENEQYAKVSTAYKIEIQQEHDVYQAIHTKNDELKFVKSILSDEQGIALYCSTKAVFKHVVKLNPEDKKQCLASLLQSGTGRDYLQKSLKSQSATEKNNINSIISELKSQTVIPTIQATHPLLSKKPVIYIDCGEEDEFEHKTKKQAGKKSKKIVKEESIEQGKKRNTEDNHDDLNPGVKKKSKTQHFKSITLETQAKPNNDLLWDMVNEDDSQIEQQFELTQSQIDQEEMDAPVIHAIVFDETDMDVENQKPSKKNKKANHARIESSSSKISEKNILQTYNTAKNKLKNIQETYKKEEIAAHATYQNDNKLSISAEKKAARAVEKYVAPLSAVVINYYSNSELFEDLLQAVRITIEFINDYPVKRKIYKSEMDGIQKCLDICNSIINSTAADSKGYQQEARDQRDIINNKHIPIINYNYAIFHHRKIAISASIVNEKNSDELSALIKKLKFDIKYLKKSLAIYEELGDEFHIHDILNNIKRCIAKSYEDLGDYQNNLLDIQYSDDNTPNQSVELLEIIKSNYQDSFEYYNNDTVWLSIRTSQYKLVEIYIACNNTDNALAELSTLIEAITMKELSFDDMATDDETQIKLETIETMLYACNKAYYVTKNDNYRLIAKDYLAKYSPLLKASLNNEMIGYINELFSTQFGPRITIDELSLQLTDTSEVLEKSTENNEMILSENNVYLAEIAKTSLETEAESSKKEQANNQYIISVCNSDNPPKQAAKNPSVSKFSLFPSIKKKPSSPPVHTTAVTMEQSSFIENTNYQYTPKDLEIILAARMHAVQDTYILASAQLYTLDQNNCIGYVLQEFINKQLSRYANSNKESTLLLPVQNGSNWIGLIVSMQGTNIIGLTYFNNLPHAMTTNMQMTSIKKQLLEKSVISNLMTIAHQITDKYSCESNHSELLLIENFCYILKSPNYEQNNVLIAKEAHQRNLQAMQSHNPEYYKSFLQTGGTGSVNTFQQQISNSLSMQSRFFQRPANNENAIAQQNLSNADFSKK